MSRAKGLHGVSQAQRWVAPLALMCALVLSFHDAAAMTNAVRVRVVPAAVGAGKSIVIAASVTPSTSTCRPTLKSPSGSARALASKKAHGSRVSWTWLVPKAAAPGRWTATVACAGAGKASARFTVLRAAPSPPPPGIPAKLEVEKHGFGVEAFSDSTFVGYGAVIRNLSPDEDALDVTVLVNVIGSSGQILKSEADFYEVIPAAATYYAGGLILINQGNAAVARIEVNVSFRERAKKAIALPPVSNVRVQSDQLGIAEVAGELQNTATKPLSYLSNITAVVFDAAGNVLGGGLGFLEADVQPGGRIGFTVSIAGRTSSEIASAQVSVEPYYG
jgi:hypothetical protein